MKQNTTMNELELKVRIFEAFIKNETDTVYLFNRFKEIAQRVNVIYDTLNTKQQ